LVFWKVYAIMHGQKYTKTLQRKNQQKMFLDL